MMDWNDLNSKFDGLMDEVQEAIKEMIERCAEYDQIVQPDPVSRCLVVRGPRLEPDQVAEIKELLPPNVPVQFFEGMKASTIQNVTNVLQKASPHDILQIMQTVSPEGASTLSIVVTGTPLDDAIWDTVRNILEQDSYVDMWYIQMNERVIVNNEPLRGEETAEEPKSRPASKPQTGRTVQTGRNKSIDKDDVVDLKIALGKTKTVEEAMNELFGGSDGENPQEDAND
jgi:hypothetical protein